MKLKTLCLAFGLAFSTLSTTTVFAKPLNSKVKYQEQLSDRVTKYPFALEALFAEHKYISLAGDGEYFGALRWVNRIYSSKNSDKAVFVRVGLDISGPVNYTELYTIKKNYVVHYATRDYRDIAVYLDGFSETEARALNGHIQKALEVKVPEKKSASWFNDILIPTANADAEGLVNCLSHKVYEKFSEEKAALSAMSPAERLKYQFSNQWTCTKATFRGVWDATGGFVVAVAKSGYKAVTDPIGTWDKVKEEFQNIKSLVANFGSVFGEASEEFLDLPYEEQAKIFCEFAGAVGTSVVLAALTAGTASPALLKVLARVLRKLASVGGKSGSRLLRLAQKLETRAATLVADFAKYKNIPSARAYMDASERLSAAERALLESKKRVDDVMRRGLRPTQAMAQQELDDAFRKIRDIKIDPKVLLNETLGARHQFLSSMRKLRERLSVVKKYGPLNSDDALALEQMIKRLDEVMGTYEKGIGSAPHFRYQAANQFNELQPQIDKFFARQDIEAKFRSKILSPREGFSTPDEFHAVAAESRRLRSEYEKAAAAAEKARGEFKTATNELDRSIKRGEIARNVGLPLLAGAASGCVGMSQALTQDLDHSDSQRE